MSKRTHIIALAFLALATAAFAEEAPAPETATSKVVLPPERSWRLGVAVGFGERTNPLVDSDDIPVYVDIDLAWFGKRWFFDNGDLGFALLERPHVTTNLVARFNSDRAYFSKTNKRYITFSSGLAPTVSDSPPLTASSNPIPPLPPGYNPGPSAPSTGGPASSATFSIKPPKRDYAIEVGAELLMDGAWGQATLSAFQDVSGTHEGFEVAAEYGYRWTAGRLSVAPTVGVRYKSAERNDYYWGVSPDEASVALAQYSADEGVNWQAGLRTSFYLTRQLRLAASANYERLDDSVAKSPLVAEDHVFGYFAGFAYSF